MEKTIISHGHRSGRTHTFKQRINVLSRKLPMRKFALASVRNDKSCLEIYQNGKLIKKEEG